MAMNSTSFDSIIADEDDLSLSAAGSALRRIPRNQKRAWTGWLGDHHLRKGDLVTVPDGTIRVVYGALRNQIILWKNAVPLYGGLPADIYPASQVRRYKNPSAVFLGRAKRGIKETASEAKREA